MDKYNLILKKSKKIDLKYINNTNFPKVCLKFKVPFSHERYSNFKEYNLKLEKLDLFFKNKKNYTILVDSVFKNFKFSKNLLKNIYFLSSDEKKVKQLKYLNKYFLNKKYNDKLVVIGGGLLINVGAYIAEKLNLDLYLFPTTVLSMADSSGGKVRINHIINNKFYKHYYKSFYEPNLIIIDKYFLDVLPLEQKRIGLVEVIKHAIFQSEELYKFLIKNDVLKDNNLLLKSIIWTSELKSICLKEDIFEKSNGSGKILRAGHNISDKLEEESEFTVPHGLAVAKGIIQELSFEKNKLLLTKAKKIFTKYKIEY